jgi:sulfate adenylyltransferase large subunit
MAAPDIEFANLPYPAPLPKQSQEKDILRFSTAGSVDDGKSTLIGRLLYDGKGAYEDQIASLRKSPVNRSSNGFDLALLTDGLRAEREQGITIDVAYRYFSTTRRKFIIADTPGHEQYTRNMATGASTSDLAVILVDACRGIMPQTRRHAFIASMLGIRHLVVAVNKMDLVDYREEVFAQICSEFANCASRLKAQEIYCIPMSALKGDNVVERSSRMGWFNGPSLLEYLHTIDVRKCQAHEFRFPVQLVIRPDLKFRGYAGQIVSGMVKQGDVVMLLPSGRTSRVRSIVTYDGLLSQAFAPMCVTLCLEDELDISRGDMIVHPLDAPQVTQSINANVIWLHEQPLDLHQTYLLKHTTHTMRARVDRIVSRTNIESLEAEHSPVLALNDVGTICISTAQSIFCDQYEHNRSTGNLILIDLISNTTVAAGMIDSTERPCFPVPADPAVRQGSVTRSEQEQRAGHRAFTICMAADDKLARILERRLFNSGYRIHAIGGPESAAVAEICRALNDAGVIAIYSSPNDAAHGHIRNAVGEANMLSFSNLSAPMTPEAAADHLYTLIHREGWLTNDPGEQPEPYINEHKPRNL